MLFWLAVAFSAFQLPTALGLLVLPSQIVRAVHVGFLHLLVFPLVGGARPAPWLRANRGSSGWSGRASPPISGSSTAI